MSPAVLYLLTGDLRSASSNALALHGVLVLSHWSFEKLWERNK